MVDGSFVKIGGELLPDSLLARVTVSQELNSHWWCELECRQTSDQRFPAEDLLGKDLSITTVGDDGSEISIFSGLILESEIEHEASGSYGGRLRAVSRSYLMDLTPRRQYYYQQSANDVAKKLAGFVGLSLEGSVDGPQLSYVQIAETDFHYLLRLADESEKWVRPTDKGIEIQDAFQSGVALDWRGEHGLLHFAAAGRLSQPAAAGAHYDYRTMQSEVSEKIKDDPAFYGSSGPMVDAVKSKSAAISIDSSASRRRLLNVSDLQNRLKKETRRSLGGGVTCKGASRERGLKAGNEVQIQGTLDANGTYGVIRVMHRWTSKGYENEFLCTPWKKYTSPNRPVAPGIEGVVPARVTDNNDPEGLGRLQVQYFWQEDSHTCWLRLMTPNAGADRGFMFLPEIGDEVWVMFEEGDPERARVLGSSWNGVIHPPREQFWGEDVAPNEVKRIVTKSGHRISIVDKPGKNSIVVATPKHLKISLIENSTETGDAVLALHSDGDILLSAPNGRIHAHSKLFSREVGGAGTAVPSSFSPPHRNVDRIPGLGFDVSTGMEPDAVHVPPSPSANTAAALRAQQISRAIDYALQHASETPPGKGEHSNCAHAVGEAIRSQHIPLRPIGDLHMPPSAHYMDETLREVGFTLAESNSPPYQKGDVAVIAAHPNHEDGHAAMWTGDQWVSNYKQGKYAEPSLPYPNKDYRRAKTKFVIYHWPAAKDK